jgi:pimeloyl-ACP methyl ester carboxylesterase
MKVSVLSLLGACAAHLTFAPTKTEGPDAAVLLFQGAFIPAATYSDLALQIQAQFPGRLFVGIPEFTFDLSLPPQLPIVSPKVKVDETLALLRGLGLKNGSSVFLAGHSIGGWAVQTFAREYPAEYKAIVLMGATIERGNEATFPVDVLTISGEYGI